MSGKTARLYRAKAYKEATEQDAWNRIKKGLPLWRRVLGRLFRSLRRKYDGWIGRAYRATVKRWSREIKRWERYEQPEQIRALKRVARQRYERERKRQERAIAEGKVPERRIHIAYRRKDRP